MKHFELFALLTFFFITQIGSAQEIVPTDYKPMPLPHYTPPLDPNYTDNRMVVFNAATQDFDTISEIEIVKDVNYKAPSEGNLSFEPELLSEKNFGGLVPADQIGSLADYPIRTTVKLLISMYDPSNGQTEVVSCSGSMIGPKSVITAGHCVDDNMSAKYAVAITVVPSYNFGAYPFGSAQMTNWYSFTAWMNNGDWNYDMAMVNLDIPIGNTVGWLGWGYNPDNGYFLSPSSLFHSLGYPGTDDNGQPFNEAGERMYYMAGYFDYFETYNVPCHYNIGYHGQSGSGLQQDNSGNLFVVGALSHGSSAVAPIHTCHCRMDQGMYNYFSSVYIVGEEELEVNDFKIYPNPAVDVVYVEGSLIESVSVSDMYGNHLMVPQENLGNKIELKFGSLPLGVYFVQSNRGTQRIIKSQ